MHTMQQDSPTGIPTVCRATSFVDIHHLPSARVTPTFLMNSSPAAQGEKPSQTQEELGTHPSSGITSDSVMPMVTK